LQTDTDTIDGTKSVDVKIDWEQDIMGIIQKRKKKTGRCPLILDDKKDDDIYQSFEYSGTRPVGWPPLDGYESCVYDKLPVEPYDRDQAIAWRNKLIYMEFAEKYIHPDDFEGIINTINQKEGFSAYSDQLDVPERSYYIEQFDRGKKSDRGPSYWHLAAPLDLNVGIPQSLTITHFSISKDKRSISFNDLAAEFGKISAEKIFYYDKFVTNYYQQRSVSAFLNCFGISAICIITEKNDPKRPFNNYLANNKPGIAVEDISAVYQDTRDAPHDRFIVFKSGDNLNIWTSTNSIDFVRFNTKGEINPDTSGTLYQSVTFTKVQPDVLGTQLTEFIMRG
jgi:hypothetical protein